MPESPVPAARPQEIKITVTNYAAMGKLVRTWVDEPTSWPKTMAEFQAQLTRHQTGGIIPPELLGLTLVVKQSDSTTYFLRIPAKNLMDASRAGVPTDPDYGIPDYYEQIAFHTAPQIDPGRRLEFHDSRIGDYTISNCR